MSSGQVSELFKAGYAVIPEPQQARLGEGVFDLSSSGGIKLAGDGSDADRFSAECLRDAVAERFGLELAMGDGGDIRLIHDGDLDVPAQGYALTITSGGVEVTGSDDAGLYYGVQTLIELSRRNSTGSVELPCVAIRDWPDIRERAVHYDTKHHQGDADYVRWLIDTTSHYKINMLVWEWEDKLAYQSHPEIGAPGAFTIAEMQAFTAYAAERHVQLVPLVQGLGHVSYILKHSKWRGLREIPDSNWEFCPLKEGSYELLFDLWDEAIEATPGVKYLHVGCDETYELGLGVECGCRDLANEHGKHHVMNIFLKRVNEHLKKRGRMMMAWGGRPDGDHADVQPRVHFGFAVDPAANQDRRDAGHEIFCYAPNPGIEPLFLPLQPFRRTTRGRPDYDKDHPGSLTRTRDVVGSAAAGGMADGMVCTSWDDSGLHISMWMPRFVCSAEYSWSGSAPTLEEFKSKYAASYFGTASPELWRLYMLLQKSAWFYYDTFQRKVWHYGDVGKVTLPDLPRWEGVEWSEFWRRRNAGLLEDAGKDLARVAEAMGLIHEGLASDIRNKYEFELYLSVARIMEHNDKLILGLGTLEECIGKAHGSHYGNRPLALRSLRQALELARNLVAEREEVLASLVETWEGTRLPKGMSTPDKQFVHIRDRARHFANRVADMRFLTIDEEMLGLEGWADELEAYIKEYEANLES